MAASHPEGIEAVQPVRRIVLVLETLTEMCDSAPETAWDVIQESLAEITVIRF